jgi:hypothetical protein
LQRQQLPAEEQEGAKDGVVVAVAIQLTFIIRKRKAEQMALALKVALAGQDNPLAMPVEELAQMVQMEEMDREQAAALVGFRISREEDMEVLEVLVERQMLIQEQAVAVAVEVDLMALETPQRLRAQDCRGKVELLELDLQAKLLTNHLT